jgi:hypothetical protein
LQDVLTEYDSARAKHPDTDAHPYRELVSSGDKYPDNIRLSAELEAVRRRQESGKYGQMDVLIEEVCEAGLAKSIPEAIAELVQVMAVALRMIVNLIMGRTAP